MSYLIENYSNIYLTIGFGKPPMAKTLIIFLLLTKTTIVFCQRANTCSCNGLIDIDYKKSIDIYTAPSGQIKNRISQDFKNEDFMTFVIDKDSADYFHLNLSYSISDRQYNGWVKKRTYLGTYSRIYTGTMHLYAKPNATSKIQFKIKTWSNSLLPIYRCKDKWAFIKFKVGHAIVEGWLQDKDQCASPYTTCN